MHKRSDNTSLPAKAQQLPQCYWLRIGLMQDAHFIRESKDSGNVGSESERRRDKGCLLVRYFITDLCLKVKPKYLVFS